MKSFFIVALTLLLCQCCAAHAQCDTPDGNSLYCHGKSDFLYFSNTRAIYKKFMEHKFYYIYKSGEFVASDSCVFKGQRYQLEVIDRNTIKLKSGQKTKFKFKLADSQTREKLVSQYIHTLAGELWVYCQERGGEIAKCKDLSSQLRQDIERLPYVPLPLFFQKADSIFRYYNKL